MFSKIAVVFVPTVLLIVPGCGDWPPVVDTRQDIQRLPASEPSVRARRLADDDIPSLARLRQLRTLDFGGGWARYKAKITDEGLRRLAALDLPYLESLDLGWCDRITDAGLAHLADMGSLKWLHLSACLQITDAGLPPLLSMKNLEALDLRGCPGITDAGLEILGRKTDWKNLAFGGCPNVTPEAVAKLQRALPAARVEKDDQEWKWSSQED